MLRINCCRAGFRSREGTMYLPQFFASVCSFRDLCIFLRDRNAIKSIHIINIITFDFRSVNNISRVVSIRSNVCLYTLPYYT